MRAWKFGIAAVVALLAVAPALADGHVAEPGITTPLLFSDGVATQDTEGEGGAASDVDVAAGVMRAEAYSATTPSSAVASSSVWADFVVGGEGEGELDAKVFGNLGWTGAWQSDAAGSIATVTIFASLLELGESEPVLVATETILDSGVDQSGCASCYGIATPEIGNMTVEFDRALAKGATYRIAFQIDVAAANPADAASFVDFNDQIPQIENGGVYVSGVGVSLEDDIDLGDEIAQINAKLDALAEQIAAAVEMAEQRFDQVDAGLVLNSMKLDAVIEDVAAVDAKVTVIDGKVDEVNAKLDAIGADIDLILEGIMDLQIVTCDLERLIMTPQGQRMSDVAVCEDQPAFPYAWPEKPLDHPSNNGHGNNGNGNGNGNASGSSGSDDSAPIENPNSRRRGGRR